MERSIQLKVHFKSSRNFEYTLSRARKSVEHLVAGDLARWAGIWTSALRYYESIGLMPAPKRVSERRWYDESIVQMPKVVQFAQAPASPCICGSFLRSQSEKTNNKKEDNVPLRSALSARPAGAAHVAARHSRAEIRLAHQPGALWVLYGNTCTHCCHSATNDRAPYPYTHEARQKRPVVVGQDRLLRFCPAHILICDMRMSGFFYSDVQIS